MWHDGACPLCAREIALMRRLDRRGCLTFVDVTTSACPLDHAAMLARLHAQEEGGLLLSGAAAFAAMWRTIPMLRALGLLAQNLWALAPLERLYVGFLRVRPRLQRWAAGARVKPAPGPAGSGRKSVWAYSRPAIAGPRSRYVRIEYRGRTVVDTRTNVRMLETTNAPSWYSGWITPDFAGPFKGVPGSMGW